MMGLLTGHRYCFPSTKTEGVAVSCGVGNLAQRMLTYSLQTDSHAENCPPIILCDWNYICADWRIVIICQRAGQWSNGAAEKDCGFDADIWAKQVQELIIDYSTCFQDAPNTTDPTKRAIIPSNLVTTHFKTPYTVPYADPSWSRTIVNATYTNTTTGVIHAAVNNTVQCTIQFTIPNPLNPPVLFYYRLTNFYQNHRRYAKSFDNDQLIGKAVSASTIHGSDCTPLTTIGSGNNILPYYPCGLAANSVFNDTFSSPLLLDVKGGSADNSTYIMQNNSDISWSSDKKLYGPSSYNWKEVAVPPNWVLRYPNNYSDDYHPDLVNDEPFQVWMRLAGLPTFSKLAQRNDTTTMQAGTYQVNINHRMSFTSEHGGTPPIFPYHPSPPRRSI